MNKHLPFKALCIFSIPSIVLITYITPSYAQLQNAQTQVQVPSAVGNLNQDRFRQAAPLPQPLPSAPPQLLQPTPKPEISPTPVTGSSIQVQKIEVIGSTIFGASELNPITEKFTLRSVTPEELGKVADAITQLYLDRGYITSRAILVNETIASGVVKIQVIEGKVERIDVKGIERLNPNYVRSRISLGTSTPLSTAKLEDQLRLLRTDPLFTSVEGSLRAGSDIGKTIVIIRVKEAQQFNLAVGVDNYSPPSIGSEKFGASASYQNLIGIGDKLTGSYDFTQRGGSSNYSFSYQVPLNAMDGTLQLRTAVNNNAVNQPPYDAFQIRGESQLYEINYRQPLVRSLQEEFALSLGFSIQNGQTFTFAGPTPFGAGPDKDGNSRTRVIKFGQDYIHRDLHGAWALRSLLNFGTGLFDPTINPDPIPDGRFFSWFLQAQRVQRLNPNNTLIAQTDLQLTPNSLLPSQQFVIGGGQSVRGFRQNARAGDNGWRFSLEDRITLEKDPNGNASLQVAPFVDLGTVWNVKNNPNILQGQRFLAGVGLGIIWQPLPKLNLRLDYGFPLVNLTDRGKNAQDDGFYFSAGYRL